MCVHVHLMCTTNSLIQYRKKCKKKWSKRRKRRRNSATKLEIWTTIACTNSYNSFRAKSQFRREQITYTSQLFLIAVSAAAAAAAAAYSFGVFFSFDIVDHHHYHLLLITIISCTLCLLVCLCVSEIHGSWLSVCVCRCQSTHCLRIRIVLYCIVLLDESFCSAFCHAHCVLYVLWNGGECSLKRQHEKN